MRGPVVAVLCATAAAAAAAGCNQLLGIDDPPETSDPCTGTCECRVDNDCGDPHAYCDDQVTSRSCGCAAGYAPDTAGCVWIGIVDDPGFSDGAAWTAAHTAVVDRTSAGMLDPGVARLPRGACAAVVTQQVVMPRYSRAEPLVAGIVYRSEAPGLFDDAGAAFGLATVWADSPPPTSSEWQTARVCLGGGQFAPEASIGKGVPVTLSVARSLSTFNCAEAQIEVDRFAIERALPGECPLPGSVTNPFANDPGGWTFSATAPGTAGFADGVGDNSTRAARLFSPARCDSTSVTVPMAVPLADPAGSPAVAFYTRSSLGTSLSPRLHIRRLSTMIGTDQAAITRACVPAYLRGATTALAIAPGHGGGLCADVVNHETIVDSVQLSSEPGCGTDPAIADPGFESRYPLLEAYQSGTATVGIVESATLARTGTGVAQLRMTACASSAYFYLHVVPPPPAGAAGPALFYWYRNTSGTNTMLQLGGSRGADTLVHDLSWHAGIRCLDPRLIGRNETVYVNFTQSGACTGAFTESAFVDDLAVGTHPSCPATAPD